MTCSDTNSSQLAMFAILLLDCNSFAVDVKKRFRPFQKIRQQTHNQIKTDFTKQKTMQIPNYFKKEDANCNLRCLVIRKKIKLADPHASGHPLLRLEHLQELLPIRSRCLHTFVSCSGLDHQRENIYPEKLLPTRKIYLHPLS